MRSAARIVAIGLVFGICHRGAGAPSLAGQIGSVITSQKGVQFSIHIVEASTGNTAYSFNPRRAIVPASNMKVVTTAAAIRYLGSDYEYKTRVGVCGQTLVVIGSGDPLLGDRTTDGKYGRGPDWVLRDIAAAIRRAGVLQIKDIIVDTSVFDDQRVHPNWPKAELNRWYACEVCGLNFNCNCIDITISNAGGKIALIVEPQTAFVNIINQVTPASAAMSEVGAYRTTQLNRITLRGKCKGTVGPFSVAVERPAAFFGFMLAEQLARDGVEVTGQFLDRPVDPKWEMKVVAEYKTRIADCIERANKDSFGLAAEALLKTIGANSSASAKGGSWEKGRQMIGQYLAGLGIDRSQFNIDDGSGLSDNNRLSAEAITRVLHDMYKSRNWEVYSKSLAVGGVDGTLGKYFKEERYKGKVLGKTGYISNAKSFSGVCLGGGRDYIFSILANKTNGQTREAINDIAAAILDWQSAMDNTQAGHGPSLKNAAIAVSD